MRKEKSSFFSMCDINFFLFFHSYKQLLILHTKVVDHAH